MPAQPLNASVAVQVVNGHSFVCLKPSDAMRMKSWADEVQLWRQEYEARCNPTQWDPELNIQPWSLEDG